MNFYLYDGPTPPIHVNENHNVFKCDGKGIYYSVTRYGDGVAIHFACEKSYLRDLKRSLIAFRQYVYELMPECNGIFAFMNVLSIERMVKRLGFVFLGTKDDMKIYWSER